MSNGTIINFTTEDILQNIVFEKLFADFNTESFKNQSKF